MAEINRQMQKMSKKAPKKSLYLPEFKSDRHQNWHTCSTDNAQQNTIIGCEALAWPCGEI